MSINELTTFLGWSTVLNVVLLLLVSLFLFTFKTRVIDIHHRLTGVSRADLPKCYFSYIGQYKLGILLLNLIPYIALKIML